jgi:rod shape-determining protein MreD
MGAVIALVTGLSLTLFTAFLQALTGVDVWTPDLVVAVVLWLGITREPSEGALTAVLLGILSDGFAGSPLGFHMLHAVLLFYVVRTMATRVRFHGVVGHVILAALGGGLSLLLLLLLARLFLAGTPLHLRVMTLAMPRLLLTTLTVPVLFAVLGRIETALVRTAVKDTL